MQFRLPWCAHVDAGRRRPPNDSAHPPSRSCRRCSCCVQLYLNLNRHPPRPVGIRQKIFRAVQVQAAGSRLSHTPASLRLASPCFALPRYASPCPRLPLPSSRAFLGHFGLALSHSIVSVYSFAVVGRLGRHVIRDPRLASPYVCRARRVYASKRATRAGARSLGRRRVFARLRNRHTGVQRRQHYPSNLVVLGMLVVKVLPCQQALRSTKYKETVTCVSLCLVLSRLAATSYLRSSAGRQSRARRTSGAF